jgi:hypothetical protein
MLYFENAAAVLFLKQVFFGFSQIVSLNISAIISAPPHVFVN